MRKGIYSFANVIWLGTRPRAMYRHHRPAKNEFARKERLYFRWYSDWPANLDRLNPPQIPVPDQSVNRSGVGGKWWFVLISDPCSVQMSPTQVARNRNRPCMGVVEFPLYAVPSPTTILEHVYEFRLEHDPLDYNYQHCEIRVYKDGKRADDLNKTVKKYYRTELAKYTQLILKGVISSEQSAR